MTSAVGARAAARARRFAIVGRAAPATLALVFVAVAVVVGLAVGPAGLPLTSVAQEILSHIPLLNVTSPLNETDQTILWQIRAPRVALGCIVGGMLAIAGGAYQGVLRNPLADPYLLGVAAGAGLGATLAIVYGPGGSTNQVVVVSAFVGAALAVSVALALAQAGGSGVAMLILAGVTVAAFLAAIQTFIQQQNSEVVQDVYSWILGRLTVADWDLVVMLLPYVAVSVIVILAFARTLDVLSLGDDEAASLGVRVRFVRLAVIAGATLGAAAAVSVAGLIAFVGLIVPHAVRLVVGSRNALVLPLSLAVGAGFLVLADVLARTALSPSELPIGVVTAIIGAPVFALLLRAGKSGAL